jgi:hypothetical protein
MPNIKAGNISSIRLAEQGADPATPAAGFWNLFTKSTGVFARNAAGVVVGPFTDAVGGGTLAGLKGVSVRRTTDYATAENNNVIAFDTLEFDSEGTLWSVGVPTRIGPIPAAWNGMTIQIHAEAIWVGGLTSNYRELKVFKNGDTATPVAVVQHAPANNNTGLELVSRPLLVATGDYFELCGRTAGAETIQSADDYSATFGLTLLASVAGPPGPEGEPGIDGTGGGGVGVGQAVAYPATFDGMDMIDGSLTTPFVDVAAFDTKDVQNGRILRLLTAGANKNQRVRVTLATPRADVFDVRIALAAMFSQYNATDDAWIDVRLSTAADAQIALARLYGRFISTLAGFRLGSKIGTGSPPAAGTDFDPALPVGLPITLRFRRDGSNSVFIDFGLGNLPMALVPLLNGGVSPQTGVVTGTLERVEIAAHSDATASTAVCTLFVDYVVNL